MVNTPMQNELPVKLTQFSRGSGCGCKISPAALREIIGQEEVLPPDPRVLVGYQGNDDAAVFDSGNGPLLISTTDFFMPVVDDAFDFGKIAAANALSDVYAMGGTPLFALAILGWPIDKLSATEARRVMEGGRFSCRMAGITIAGGHSIDSPEPLFGLAVTGSVVPSHLKRNDTAQPGDVLYLTKPLGSGTLAAAAKRGLASPEQIETATSYMSALNQVGTALGALPGVHAMTDVTGFGLGGHLVEVCEGSDTTAVLRVDRVAVMPGVVDFHKAFVYPDMTMKTYQFIADRCTALNAAQILLLCDPQSSGGLLVSVSPEEEKNYLALVRDFGLAGIADKPIGRMERRGDNVVVVEA
jgi:selenide,water dikinase